MHAAAAAAVAATIDSPNVTTASAITAITTSAAAIPATTAFTQRLLHVHRRALSIAWPVFSRAGNMYRLQRFAAPFHTAERPDLRPRHILSLIHISEPTRLGMISYAVFCLKKKKKT